MSLLSYQTLPTRAEGAADRRARLAQLASTLGPLVGLIFVFALFTVMVWSRTGRLSFLTMTNLEVILLQTAVVGIAALGMTLIIISGGIDLSVGSNIALVTVVVALMLRETADPQTFASPPWAPPLAVVAGILAATAIGGVIGLLITQLRLSPFIATLGMWGAVRGLAKGLGNEQTVQAPETWVNELLRLLRPDERWMIFTPGVWIMLVLALLVAGMLRYTRFGRHIFAIGSNEQTARLCGVPVARTKILIYLTAGALAGVAGLLQFSGLTMGDPTTANGLELNIIAAVVIGGASLSGGQGSVLGTIIGALIMSVVAKGSSAMGWRNWHQEIITGGIIILAVTLDQLRQRRNT